MKLEQLLEQLFAWVELHGLEKNERIVKAALRLIAPKLLELIHRENREAVRRYQKSITGREL